MYPLLIRRAFFKWRKNALKDKINKNKAKTLIELMEKLNNKFNKIKVYNILIGHINLVKLNKLLNNSNDRNIRRSFNKYRDQINKLGALYRIQDNLNKIK